MSKPLHRRPLEGTWISWLGSAAQFLVTSPETNGHYCVSRATSPPGGGAPPHRHDFEEGFYLLSGELTFTAGNQTHRLKAGDFINIGARVAHSIRNESGKPAEFLIVCAPAGFDQFQIEGGFPMSGPEGDLVPMSDEVKRRIARAAEKHGVDMSPPPEAFQETPRATVVRNGEGLTVDVVGDRYRFFVEGKSSEEKYSIWEAVLYPGGGPPPHTHTREEEGFFVLEGCMTFYTPDGSFEATEGHFVHLARDGKHWFRNNTEQLTRALILVAPAGLEEMFRETGVVAASPTAPFSPPRPNEKQLLLEAAPRYGVTIHIPQHD